MNERDKHIDKIEYWASRYEGDEIVPAEHAEDLLAASYYIERLGELIDKAPHSFYCSTQQKHNRSLRMDKNFNDLCDCWKSETLEPPE